MGLNVDPELVRAACSRDVDGMERLLETLWPHAYRIARSIVQNDTLAEDAAQEACAIIYRELPALRSTAAFRTWMYRIVAREAVRAARSQVERMPVVQIPSTRDPDEAIDVLRAVGMLPPDLRATVVLHYYADLTSSEIGVALGIPSATVRFKLARARQRLQKLLGDDATYHSYETREVAR